jgi:hypothetical protein
MSLMLSADGTNENGVHTLRELEVFLSTCRQLGMPDETEIAARVKFLKMPMHGPVHNITASWPGAAIIPAPSGAPPSEIKAYRPAEVDTERPTVVLPTTETGVPPA